MFRTLSVAAAIVMLTAVPAASQDRTTSQLLQNVCLFSGSFYLPDWRERAEEMNMIEGSQSTYALQKSNGEYRVKIFLSPYSDEECDVIPPVSVTRDQIEKSVSDSIGSGWVRTVERRNHMGCESPAPPTYETIWTRRPAQPGGIERIHLRQNIEPGIMGCEDPVPGFNLRVVVPD
jgi:hypothetical protein